MQAAEQYLDVIALFTRDGTRGNKLDTPALPDSPTPPS